LRIANDDHAAAIRFLENVVCEPLANNETRQITTTYKSHASDRRTDHDIILAIHGFNARPDTLEPFIKELNLRGFDVVGLNLYGHKKEESLNQAGLSDIWLSDIKAAYQEIETEFPGSEISVLGYSLGAALAVYFLEKEPDVQFSKMFFLAPAFVICDRAMFVRMLLPLKYFGVSLPSIAPREYRAHRFTPLRAYSGLFKIVDEISSLKNNDKNNEKLNQIPTEMVFVEGDELIDFPKTRKWLARNKLSSWQTELIEAQSVSNLNYKHLIFEKKNIESSAWDKLIARMVEFLS